MSYEPGLHILATIQSAKTECLQSFESFQFLINEVITEYALNKLGEVYHNFSPEGYTAVICLSESHISIHTWPEYRKVNVDIYLSNFKRINDHTVQHIFDRVVHFFEGEVTHKTALKR